MNILISRTDNIGDVVLTFPLLGKIKELYPSSKIFFLGKNYTKDLCSFNSNIDTFLNWSDLEAKTNQEIVSILKQHNLEYVIHVFPNKRFAKLAKKAGIKNRIGTSHRLFHFLTCNKKVDFTRKNSNLHEAQLNFQLLTPLTNESYTPNLSELPNLYKMNVHSTNEKVQIDKSKVNLIFHTKSFGSAVDWKLENYIKLCELLDPNQYHVYFSGTEKESELISPFIKEIVDKKIATDVTGMFNLKEFIEFINQCNGMVACSTGPLHIASCLDKFVIGLYSTHRPIHAGRWCPIGKNAHFIESNDENDNEPNINQIQPESVLSLINSMKINHEK